MLAESSFYRHFYRPRTGQKMTKKTFDEGLGPKHQSYLYFAVLEFFLCYSKFIDRLVLLYREKLPRNERSYFYLVASYL